MSASHPNSPIGPNEISSNVRLVLAGSRSRPLRSDPAPKRALDHTSVCSASSKASSTSMPRYRTVLSSLV
jgi:hypothetical protein